MHLASQNSCPSLWIKNCLLLAFNQPNEVAPHEFWGGPKEAFCLLLTPLGPSVWGNSAVTSQPRGYQTCFKIVLANQCFNQDFFPVPGSSRTLTWPIAHVRATEPTVSPEMTLLVWGHRNIDLSVTESPCPSSKLLITQVQSLSLHWEEKLKI